jgi:hypothetical protein
MASYSDSVHIRAFNYTRDSALPAPEVCDWLLVQEWSKPGRIDVQSREGSGYTEECCRARAMIGKDECIDLFLPAGAIFVLREDARARAAVEWMQDQMKSA